MDQNVRGGVFAVGLAWFLGGIVSKSLEFGFDHYSTLFLKAVMLSVLLFCLVCGLGFIRGWPLILSAVYLVIIGGLRGHYFNETNFVLEEPWYANSFYVALGALLLIGVWYLYYRWYEERY